MEVVIVKMPLEDYENLAQTPLEIGGHWLVKEQYFETQEIIDKEIEAQLSNQHTKDLYKELKELKHPKK